MSKIKWAVIGSGGIARRRTIPEGIIQAKNAELVSVYDIDTKVNEEVAKENSALAVESIKELLETDCDAVYIATPAYLHREQVLLATSAGKHILCEKPLGMNTQEAKLMAEECAKKNVILGTAFMMRFQSQHQKALELINAGRLGKLVYGRAQLSCWYPPIKGAWRQDPNKGGGGSLMDLGGHCLDLLEMFFGEVAKLSCFINNQVHSYKSEDSAVVNLFFKSGAFATMDALFCIPDNSSKNKLEIYGTAGSILAEQTIGQSSEGIMKAYFKKQDSGYDAQQQRQTNEGQDINPVPINTYKAEIEEFSSAILQKRLPFNIFQAGLSSQLLIDACYESAKKGISIALNN